MELFCVPKLNALWLAVFLEELTDSNAVLKKWNTYFPQQVLGHSSIVWNCSINQTHCNKFFLFQLFNICFNIAFTLSAIIVSLDNQHLYFYHIQFDSSVYLYILCNLYVAVAPTWLIEPQDVSVLFQHPVSLHCQATGFPSPTITWMKAKG